MRRIIIFLQKAKRVATATKKDCDKPTENKHKTSPFFFEQLFYLINLYF